MSLKHQRLQILRLETWWQQFFGIHMYDSEAYPYSYSFRSQPVYRYKALSKNQMLWAGHLSLLSLPTDCHCLGKRQFVMMTPSSLLSIHSSLFEHLWFDVTLAEARHSRCSSFIIHWTKIFLQITSNVVEIVALLVSHWRIRMFSYHWLIGQLRQECDTGKARSVFIDC